MTNEEKARELLKTFNFRDYHNGHKVYGFTLDRMKQMSEWKEQQMVDRAVEWLKEYAHNYFGVEGKYANDVDLVICIDEMLEDFKQTMKEE